MTERDAERTDAMGQPSLVDSNLVLEAAVATRRGVSHDRNQDAFAVDVAGGFFVIADGMGGHRDGHVASNAVVSILGHTLMPDASFEDKIDSATRALVSVNATLYEQSLSQAETDICGSTVVSLIVGDAYACCLWVGDSRLYLSRGKDLYLLSQDHAAFNGTLTRAVGSSADLDIERRIIEIETGDIFVLCSDGLLKGIEEEEITAMLSQPGEAPADRLLAKAVAGGSLDDITLVLVWVLERGA